jgi:hypothetical protein
VALGTLGAIDKQSEIGRMARKGIGQSRLLFFERFEFWQKLLLLFLELYLDLSRKFRFTVGLVSVRGRRAWVWKGKGKRKKKSNWGITAKSRKWYCLPRNLRDRLRSSGQKLRGD